jgi:hypothetical protein
VALSHPDWSAAKGTNGKLRIGQGHHCPLTGTSTQRLTVLSTVESYCPRFFLKTDEAIASLGNIVFRIFVVPLFGLALATGALAQTTPTTRITPTPSAPSSSLQLDITISHGEIDAETPTLKSNRDSSAAPDRRFGSVDQHMRAVRQNDR